MLASQRELFEMPRHICYLNAASYSPLPLRTQEAGRAAVARKATPWTIDAGFAHAQYERTRAAAARLINADVADVALTPSVSYGVATAAKILTIPRGSRVKRQGALFLIDATQSVGVLAMDVKRLDPDFVLFPTYKWLLGPYGRAFMYIARRHQGGIPLEQTAYGRRDVRAENAVYFADLRYASDARRFDMGERDYFISMEMAAIGMEMMAEWGAHAIAERLSMLTDRIAQELRGLALHVPDRSLRAPHLLCLAFKGGMPNGLIEGLGSEGIYVAPRLGRMRISPHVYNDEIDADRFVVALTRRLKG